MGFVWIHVEAILWKAEKQLAIKPQYNQKSSLGQQEYVVGNNV